MSVVIGGPLGLGLASATKPYRNIAGDHLSQNLHHPMGHYLKALARAFPWKRMLQSGEFATIAEMAAREGIAPSYMARVLRLTLLAPNIVEAILNGKHGPEVTLAKVLEPSPAKWAAQLERFQGVY